MSPSRLPTTTPLPTVLITGASSGLGHALSLQWARSGARVIAVGRDTRRLQALAALRPGITPVVADLRDPAAIATLVQQALASHADLACLVNNAGIQHARRLDDPAYGAQALQDEVATNLLAPMLLAQALLPHLLRQPAAWIVNIGSVLGLAPKPTAAAYSATKAGLRLFGDGLRLQLQASRVAVVDVALPLVDTPMTAGRGSGKLSAQDAAAALVRGLQRGGPVVVIGKARAAQTLHRWAPGVLARVMARGG